MRPPPHAGGPAAPLARLLPGDHTCWFFGSAEEHRAGVTAFVRSGLEGGGKVVYLADAIPPPVVAGYLRGAGMDPDRLQAEGRLVLGSFSDGGDRDRGFDPMRQLESLGGLVEQARADGYQGVWVTGEGTWQLRDDRPGAERLRPFEQRLERFIAGRDDALALCQYDASALRPGAAERLRPVHNLELAPAGPRPLARTAFGVELVPTEDGLAISGEVDLPAWAALANALRRVADPAAGGDVVLELGGLQFIDGHGVGLIGQAARALDPPRRLVLRAAPPMLLRIAELLRLDRVPRLLIEGRGGAARR